MTAENISLRTMSMSVIMARMRASSYATRQKRPGLGSALLETSVWIFVEKLSAGRVG